MKAKVLLSALALVGITAIGANANATIQSSGVICHQLYQSDVSRISYNAYGVTSDNSYTSTVYLSCAVPRSPSSGDPTYYVDFYNYSTQAWACGLNVENSAGSMTYSNSQSGTFSAGSHWFGWTVPNAQQGAYVNVQCRIPPSGQGMLVGIEAN
jgi:hypothetical protein